jgi:hypothetical protein
METLVDLPAQAYKQFSTQTSQEHRMATYKVGYFVGSLARRPSIVSSPTLWCCSRRPSWC